MIGELIPVRVDPVTADASFWKRFHEFRHVRDLDLDPDDPIQPDGDVEIRLRRPEAFEIHHYFEISRDGQMIAWFRGESSRPTSPEYATNKHLFWTSAYVRREHRRRGLATRWMGVVAQLMKESGCTVVGMSTHQEPGHAFIKWLGAEPKLTDIESRLKLSDVGWPMVERWVREGEQRSPGTRLEIYDGPLPEAMWADFAAQRTALLNTMPFEDLDLGDIIVTPERLREWYERVALTREVPHEVLTREPDGVISGMTDTEWAPYRPKLIWQAFTGVLPAARGRGIGKWIKAAMLLHLREVHPDAEWIATGNAQSNDPMLAINRNLGFKPYRQSTEYQTTLEKLESGIRR